MGYLVRHSGISFVEVLMPQTPYLDATDRSVAITALDNLAAQLSWPESQFVTQDEINQITDIVFASINAARANRKP